MRGVRAQQLGRYSLQDVVGVGSFATVHRAQDQLLDDTVVIKVLAENHSLNPEIRERFIAEGRALRRVTSQHIVTVHDIGESDRQQPYLVLEHADRGTLADRVRLLRARGWKASEADVLAVVRPLAAALQAVHSAQLVHRDLSPGNLLLTTDTEVDSTFAHSAEVVVSGERLLLADLGMCKDLAINSGLTVSGGTAGFRPPEQAGPSLVDTRADIWAASALVHWLTRGADLPKAFHRAIKRGMQTPPGRRQQTVAEWAEEIEVALTPQPDPTPELEPVTSRHAPVPRRRGMWRVLAAVVVLTLALGVVGGFLLGRNPEPVAEGGGASISIDGPDEISVGEPATFTAEVSGVDSWVWLLPVGRYSADESEVRVTPTAPGTAELILRARGPDGSELEDRHQIRVTE